MNLREEDLRSHIENWLKQKGIATEREVACGNGVRADLVTSDTVIEVKKQLNRGAIYQAYGQGVAYQTLLKKPKLMIIGLAPSSEARYQEAQRIAENVRGDNVEVVFIDKDPKWGLSQAAIAAQAKSESKPADKSPDKLPGKPSGKKTQSAVRLPFEVAAANAEAANVEAANAEASGDQASAQASRESSKAKSTVKPDKPASPKSDRKSVTFTRGDIWTLLLIILLFLWIRAYVWRVNSQQNSQQNSQPISPDNQPVQLDAPSQPDPLPTPFTVPSVPQK